MIYRFIIPKRPFSADDWDTFISPLVTDPAIRKLVDEIFKPETILNVLFSGEKDWLQPADCNITMSNLTGILLR